MTLLAALTSLADDPIQIHKKVVWNDFVRSFPFQMFQLISEHITYVYSWTWSQRRNNAHLHNGNPNSTKR